MDNRFTPLEGDEVLSVDESVRILMGHRTFRTSEFIAMLQEHLVAQGGGAVAADRDGWFTAEGVACESLRFGANGWLKGRVRVNLEFCPDESSADLTSFSATAAPEMTITDPPTPTEVVVEPQPELATPELAIPETTPETILEPNTPEPISTEVAAPVAAGPIEAAEGFLGVSTDDYESEVSEGMPAADDMDDGLDLGDNLLATTEDEDIGDIFADAPVDLSQDEAVEEPGSSLVDQMVDGLVDEVADDDTEDIFASAPIDLSDENAADDLFGESETTDAEDVFGDAVDELPDSEVNPFVETPEDDALSGLLDDADDIFADAPTDMSTPVPGLENDDDLFATGDDSFGDSLDDATVMADTDDLFGQVSEGELDMGEASTADATELAVEDAEDLFGDDDDDAIDWGLDDEDETPLATDSKPADDTGEDAVFADIWNDIDEMA